MSGNLLNLLQDFLTEKKQSVSMLFLIYINDLTDGLTTTANLFADDTSLFSFVHGTQTSANNLNKDLKIINNWAYQ